MKRRKGLTPRPTTVLVHELRKEVPAELCAYCDEPLRGRVSKNGRVVKPSLLHWDNPECVKQYQADIHAGRKMKARG